MPQAENVAPIGRAGATRPRGGLFTTEQVTLTGSIIARNVPDQCSGC